MYINLSGVIDQDDDLMSSVSCPHQEDKKEMPANTGKQFDWSITFCFPTMTITLEMSFFPV